MAPTEDLKSLQGMTAIASDGDRKLTPIEQMLKDLSNSEVETNPDQNQREEIVAYLMTTIRLAERKTRSKKLPDLTKIRWTRAGIEASKVLLYSDSLDKHATREVRSIQQIFASFYQQNTPSVAASEKNYDIDELM